MRRIEFAELRGDPVMGGNTVRLFGRVYHGPIKIGDIFSSRGYDATPGRGTAVILRRSEVARRVEKIILANEGVGLPQPG